MLVYQRVIPLKPSTIIPSHRHRTQHLRPGLLRRQKEGQLRGRLPGRGADQRWQRGGGGQLLLESRGGWLLNPGTWRFRPEKNRDWWLTYPSKKSDFVSWDDDIPNNIWKVIKFMSKPPTNEKIASWDWFHEEKSRDFTGNQTWWGLNRKNMGISDFTHEIWGNQPIWKCLSYLPSEIGVSEPDVLGSNSKGFDSNRPNIVYGFVWKYGLPTKSRIGTMRIIHGNFENVPSIFRQSHMFHWCSMDTVAPGWGLFHTWAHRKWWNMVKHKTGHF